MKTGKTMTDKSPTKVSTKCDAAAQKICTQQANTASSELVLDMPSFNRLIQAPELREDTTAFYYVNDTSKDYNQHSAHIVFPTEQDRTLFILRYSDYL